MRSLGGRGMGRFGIWALGLIAAAAACGEGSGPTAPAGSPHPVTGRVTVGGRPAAGVRVRLHPLNRFNDADAPRPEATTDKEGRFRLHTGADREGAPDGRYVATLVWPAGAGGADRLGGAFAEPDGSGLVATIDAATAELPTFAVEAGGRRGAGAR